MEAVLSRLVSLVWGWPLLTLLLGSGLWLHLRLRGRPLRDLPRAMGRVFRSGTGQGIGVSPLGALCTALSATIGTGNLVGVATAISLGGPGALLWMELGGLAGLSLKYAEGWLAVRYRFTDGAGRHSGGPFAYIELGLGPRWRPLARVFAVFGALAGLCGVGTFVQVGSLTACLSAFLSRVNGGLTVLRLPWGRGVPAAALGAGLAVALLAVRPVFGGRERVSRGAAVLVPVMGAAYVICCLMILGRNLDALPAVLGRILREAFRPAAPVGGLLGVATAGIRRGVFSNEAGLGTGPIAASWAETGDPETQAQLSMTATVFDTFLICTLTGLVILVTGSQGAGVWATMGAFARGLPLPEPVSMGLVVGFLALFAYTTVVGWSCYGAACLDYLTQGRRGPRLAYLTLYLLTAALAPLCSARGIWLAADLCNGLMAVPNLLALLLLFGTESFVQFS